MGEDFGIPSYQRQILPFCSEFPCPEFPRSHRQRVLGCMYTVSEGEYKSMPESSELNKQWKYVNQGSLCFTCPVRLCNIQPAQLFVVTLCECLGEGKEELEHETTIVSGDLKGPLCNLRLLIRWEKGQKAQFPLSFCLGKWGHILQLALNEDGGLVVPFCGV